MKKTNCIIMIVAFAALFGTSAYFLIDHYRQESILDGKGKTGDV